MRKWLAVCISVLAAGCINTSVQRLDHAVRPPSSPELVSVLLEEPQRPYTVIATIESTGETAFDGFDDLQDAIVAEAARLGGEALILGSGTTDTNFILTGTAMIRSDRKKLTGEVIVFSAGG